MITKCNKGWRNELMLCAATAVAVLVSSCNSPAPEAGRYQWTYVPKDTGSDELYVIDTVTGEVAVSHKGTSGWAPVGTFTLPDWNAIREMRLKAENRFVEQMKRQEEAREKLVKSYSQMPLEKQVAWAETISIGKLSGKRLVGKTSDNKDDYVDEFTILETLKKRVNQKGGRDIKWPYKATDDGMVVFFSGIVDEGPFQFGLSRTSMKRNDIFSAPATIIDDVKAEIKRQEEQKK